MNYEATTDITTGCFAFASSPLIADAEKFAPPF